MRDLVNLLRHGSFVIQTEAPSEQGPSVVVAATLFCRDGSTLQLLRRPPAEQASAARLSTGLERHRSDVAARLQQLARELTVLRASLGVTASVVAAILWWKINLQEVARVATGGTVDMSSVGVHLARIALAVGGGAAVHHALRASLRWYLKRRLSGG